jgi:hypothetical protein
MSKLLERAIEEVRGLPENDQEAVAAQMLDEVRRRTPRRGKWATVADELADLNVFGGQSDEFVRDLRELRDSFFRRRSASQ